MDMEEKKLTADAAEQALPVQELPADIPAEVRQKLAEDLNEEATEDLKQDMREAEKEEANDEEVKANPEMLTKSRLLKLLIKKQYVKLREVTEEEQPADLAELLEELDENNRLVVFRLLKKDVATEAFAYMSDEARDDLVNAFSDVELVSAIEDMSLDDAADLLEDMPAGVVKRVLEKSSRQTRESLNKLLNYPESSAGSLMTPEYVRLRQEMTVSDAFAAIRKQGENAETVYTCYVVERNRLLGVVSARSLLLSDPSTPIVDIMDDNVVTVKVTDDQEFVAREMVSLGIETLGGVMTKLIEANTTIPTKKSEVFSTAADNQPSVEIHILQGERPMARDNKTIGRFHLDSIPPAPRGVPQIEVTFDIDANGILNVSAKDKATGKEQSIRIEASSGLSDAEIKRMKDEAAANAASDQQEKEKVDTINKADSMIFQTEKQLKEFGDKLPADKKAPIESALQELKEAHKAQDVARINSAIDKLNSVFQAASQEMYNAQAQQQQGGAQQGPQGNPNAGQPNNGGKDQEVTDVDFEEVK